jgi:hypothetical protein
MDFRKWLNTQRLNHPKDSLSVLSKNLERNGTNGNKRTNEHIYYLIYWSLTISILNNELYMKHWTFLRFQHKKACTQISLAFQNFYHSKFPVRYSSSLHHAIFLFNIFLLPFYAHSSPYLRPSYCVTITEYLYRR